MMAFSSPHTYAVALLEGVASASNVMTWGIMNTSGRLLQDLQNSIYKNMQLVYHGIGGLIDIVHWKTQSIDSFYLCHLSTLNTLEGKKGTIDIQK